jgi:hypothetical protein
VARVKIKKENYALEFRKITFWALEHVQTSLLICHTENVYEILALPMRF